MPTLCKTWLRLSFGIFFSLLIGGCEGNSVPDPQIQVEDDHPERGGTVIIRAFNDPGNLNRISKNLGFVGELENYIFPFLINLDYNTLDPIPHLAKSEPEVSEDGKTYTFHLRENATWADGKPLTSEDVLFSWKLYMLAGIAMPNFAAYYGEILESMESDSQDHGKVIFHLKHPINDGSATIGGLAIYPRHLWDPDNLLSDFTVQDALTNLDQVLKTPKVQAFKTLFESEAYLGSPELFQGAGPYKLSQYIPGEKVELERVQNWWGDQVESEDWMWKAYPDRLIYRFIPDHTAAILELKSGNVDVCPAIPSPDFLSLSKETGMIAENWRFIQQPRMMTIQIQMNNRTSSTKGPCLFVDVRVRKAMDLLMDKKLALENIYEGLGEYLDGPVPRTLAKYVSPNLKPTQPDIEKAKSLLSEAGWEDTNGNGTRDKMIQGRLVEMKPNFIYNNSSPQSAKIFSIFADACKQAGIELTDHGLAAELYNVSLKKHEFDMALNAIGIPPVIPDFKEAWYSESWDSGTNYSGFASAEVDSLILVARNTQDKEARKQLIFQIQERIVAEQPCIWLLSTSEKFGVKKKWNGVATFATNPYIVYSGMWLAKPQADSK